MSNKYRAQLFAIFLLISMFGVSSGFAQSSKAQANDGDGSMSVTPGQLHWHALASPGSRGLELAVLEGDPSQSGAFYAVALKMADGYRTEPHWHPTESNLIIVKGTLLIGFGEKVDQSKYRELPAGSFLALPKDVRIFEQAKGETIIYMYGPGPLRLLFVNPAESPDQSSAFN
jgi:quercetin dioxygenase-like cupin family protein